MPQIGDVLPVISNNIVRALMLNHINKYLKIHLASFHIVYCYKGRLAMQSCKTGTKWARPQQMRLSE